MTVTSSPTADRQAPFCPLCDANGAGQGACARCGFPLHRLQQWMIVGDNRESTPRPAIEYQNAATLIRLTGPQAVLLGRGEDPVAGFVLQTVRHRALAEHHVAFLIGDRDALWLVDCDAKRSCVFVEGKRASIARIHDGVVVQIGPLAWQYNAAKRVLTPLTPISGFDLFVDAEVPGRFLRTQLHIRRGEMTALVGPSGCGKSTLLETIRDGSGLAGEAEIAGRIFFVPQRDLVHHDLRLGDALLAIGRFYHRDPLPFEIDAALDAVGLPTSAKDKFPSQLSGGQLRRFRIAGALLSGAGVIVLDEPDSGLDHETADEVISLLHALAIRGATIVAVTHHRHVLSFFDRVITMEATANGGKVVDANGEESDSSSHPLASNPVSQSEPDPALAAEDLAQRIDGRLGRLLTLVRRERQKLTSPRLSRRTLGSFGIPHLIIGMLFVPLLFAGAIAVSVPTDPKRDLADGLYGEMWPIARLGFLAVISVIWMSASGSHLSITRDREVYDYERSQGLTWSQILTAKSFVLVISGVCQTLVFAGLLYCIRYSWLSRSFFVDERSTQYLGVVLCLLFVSIAATMLGLFISALAGRTPLIATAILPVVMMFQILFSASFAVSDPDGYEPLVDYQQLTVFAAADGEDGSSDEWQDEDMQDKKPLWVTSFVSYATLSRYGDQWLRSFALTTDPPEGAKKVQWISAAALLLVSTLCFIASWLSLWAQTTRLGIRRMATVVVVLLSVGLVGNDQAIAQENVPPAKTIHLPLVDGRYDENRLRRAFGAQAESEPQWRAFDASDRIGLVALEWVGKIEFSIANDELVITLKATPQWDLIKQLAPPRLIGIDQVGDARDVIVFVHGLEGGASTFLGAAESLQTRGIAALRFDYPNDGPPAEIGDRLAEQLTTFCQDHPQARVHLVAHSLGGLISTWAVTRDGFPATAVPHVFTLGTPFAGSALAAFHDELELFDVAYRLATGTPDALNTIADGRGQAAAALEPGSEFLTNLARQPRPPGIAFHLAAGTQSFLTDSRRDRLVQRLPAELARLSVSPAYAARVQELLAAQELHEGLGDGAVTVKSAFALADPAETKTFPLNHTALVASKAPLEWVLEVLELHEPVNPQAK